LLRVSVVVCPAKNEVGVKVQVTLDGQDGVITPLNPLTADAEIVKHVLGVLLQVVAVVPIIGLTVVAVAESEN